MSVDLLSDEEMKTFIEAAGKEEGESRLILLMLLGTGISAAELIDLRVENFRLAEGWVSVRNPISWKSRKVPLAEPLRRELWDYIEDREPGLLFGRSDGQRRTLERVNRLVRQTGKKAGVEREVRPNEIRGTIGRLLAKKGASDDQITAFFGYRTGIAPSFTSPAGILGLLIG